MWLATLLAAFISMNSGAAELKDQAGLISSMFIYERAPFPECHASTIVESKGKIIAAWFGGTEEKHKDVEIWTSFYENGKWTTPKSVANGIDGGNRHPTWNPVLFQPRSGPLMLFYKVGPSPDTWWGMWMTSEDQGRTWSQPQRLASPLLGPIKNKPVQLASGDIISGSSDEAGDLWKVHFELSRDGGKTWNFVGPVNDGKEFAAIQPTILIHNDGRLQALVRTKQGRLGETWSNDSGKTWSKMAASALPNPDAGADGVTLADGTHLLVLNPTLKGRSPLTLASSKDGKTWKQALVLENQPGEYSYPAIIQTSDGRVHVTYTWKREKIRHAVIDPAKVVLTDLPNPTGKR